MGGGGAVVIIALIVEYHHPPPAAKTVFLEPLHHWCDGLKRILGPSDVGGVDHVMVIT